MDIAQPFAMAHGFAMLTGLVEVPAMLDQLCPQSTHGSVLVGITVAGHHQHTANAEETAGIGQRLTMVARCTADDAPAFLLFGEPGHQVNAATDLERRRWRVIFVFEEKAATQEFREGGPFVQRRR